jgi:signal transduction histidine kinase
MSEQAERVLIVDDVPENIQISAHILQSEGYELYFAENGERALEEARERPIDLILLDIMMPGMDGITVCKELMKDERTGDIPVIFLTALGDTEHIEQAFGAGGVDYVVKPIRWRELLARVRTHIRLRKQNRELSELNSTKDKLFSIIAHDLKNPFNSIIGLADLAREEHKEGSLEELDEYLDMISRSAHQGYELLENLLQWSRAQTNRIEFAPQTVDLSFLTERALDLLRQNARKKEITLQNGISRGTLLYCDYQMVHFIVRNLVSNAIKFTGNGGTVSISAGQQGEEAILSVADDGVGMDEEHRRRLFQLDTNVSRDGTAGERGTGLGLVVCKEFVDTHGGRIEVYSTPGEGTRFDILLPLHRESEEHSQAARAD